MAKSDPDGKDEKVKNETDGGGQKWYMDSVCSKHMIGEKDHFLSLKAFQSGSVSFENSKKVHILGVEKVERTIAHAIENAYFVNGLKYSLVSVSQICDRGNEVKFLSCSCTVTSLKTGEVVLVAKRFKNVYVIDFGSQDESDLTCLSAIEEDPELWHRRLGHASFSLLNKLVVKDLIRGLPKAKFKDHNTCDASIRWKQEALEKFDAKSDEGIFLEYFSHSKAYKVYKKRTQTEEESVHVIFNESSFQRDVRVLYDEEED
ncbi:uncharacterized protein LOC132637646 [Lycium barbarum]|uniref:uncharacterized protein LOC132637646 n=1 Tax=Lycium barbarum TaxID=112863 RepID=UPI00293E9077|nr:uncharacterized protein LOC132637646 [Lycium barbarum]